MQPDLLSRLRWGNLARAAAVLAAIAAVVAWPRLDAPEPDLPADRPQPAAEALGYASSPEPSQADRRERRGRPAGRPTARSRRATGARRRVRRHARGAAPPRPRGNTRSPAPAPPAPPVPAPPRSVPPASPAPSELAAPVVPAPRSALPEFGVEPGA